MYPRTINNFERRTLFLLIGLVRYILNVPLEYSPETISDATIVLKNGIWLIKIAIIIYVSGLIFGAVVLDMWSAETSPKALLGILWTTFFAISLFYIESKNK